MQQQLGQKASSRKHCKQVWLQNSRNDKSCSMPAAWRGSVCCLSSAHSALGEPSRQEQSCCRCGVRFRVQRYVVQRYMSDEMVLVSLAFMLGRGGSWMMARQPSLQVPALHRLAHNERHRHLDYRAQCREEMRALNGDANRRSMNA